MASFASPAFVSHLNLHLCVTQSRFSKQSFCRRARVLFPAMPSLTSSSISSSQVVASLSDPYVLQLAETLEDSLPPSSSSVLQKLRDASSESLLSTPWPSRKDEAFRFTDISFLKSSEIIPISQPSSQIPVVDQDDDSDFPRIVIVDGHFSKSLSNLSNLGENSNVYVNNLSSISSDQGEIAMKVSDVVSKKFDTGDLFWSLNGLGTPDLVVVYVPKGCHVEKPLHLRYCSSYSESSNHDTKLPISNPRVLIFVEEEGEISIIEEYLDDKSRNGSHWVNAVTEILIGGGGKVHHSYTQMQSINAAHIKWTSVQQESASSYELVEISSGGKLSRHSIHVQQLGPDTVTEMAAFHLSTSDQTQDLHSKIVLDHPGGYSRQLHKCIVAHSDGQVVFDGNVKVNRYAQQTDAGQLTRSLLLAPRATVNVKPNLQIIADDVKCSHGAAISDLEEDQLFYFQTRGVDLQTARRAITFSFAGDVVQKLPYPFLRKKVEKHVQELLESAISSNS